MSPRSPNSNWVVGLVFLAAVPLLGMAAPARDSSLAGTAALDAPEQHCVALAQRTKIASPPIALCFATFAEAIEHATGGSTQIDPASPSRHLTQEELTGAGTSSSTVISVDYANASFTGSTLTWYTDNPNGCNDGTVYYASSMPSGWNDVVSSAASYQGCKNYWHFEHINRGGAALNCFNSCSSMGAMNDATSSEEWSCGLC